MGIVQIGILSIHCIILIGTMVIVDHANKASTSCSVALIPIHISTTLTLHSLPNQNSYTDLSSVSQLYRNISEWSKTSALASITINNVLLKKPYSGRAGLYQMPHVSVPCP